MHNLRADDQIRAKNILNNGIANFVALSELLPSAGVGAQLVDRILTDSDSLRRWLGFEEPEWLPARPERRQGG